jgi:protein-S-isoprenylcysteine O-methyltransferase Ste14
MSLVTFPIITTCWGIFFIVWVLAAIFSKRTVHRQSGADRLRYLIPVILGWFLLFRGWRFPPPLNLRVIPQSDVLHIIAAILCVSGLILCLCARAILGRNWSGTVTLKENHELIVRGPYRFVRHPIYTGLTTMLLATALQLGHLAGLLGLVLVFVSFWIKSNAEEDLMLKQFPEQYPAYRERVKRIIPWIL